MKIYILLFVFIFASCSRPLYIKNRHFDCNSKEYKMDTDVKELVYKSIERAFVVRRDIPDYQFLWKKHRIYVSNEYQTSKTKFINQEDWNQSLSYLKSDDVPNFIRSAQFCVKSKEELQKISNRTWEDFLHVSFLLIQIEGDTATIKINNSWITSKHSKLKHQGGGGYTSIYKKINGVWTFQKITSNWIS